MNSFVHVEYSNHHPGVVRLENTVQFLERAGQALSSAKGLSAMLLAAMVAALVVVADQLIHTWADGHLLAAWVTLWLVGFAALGLLAGPARRMTRGAIGALGGWWRAQAHRRADARLWRIAQQDARVMADLQAAMTRAQG